MRKATLSLLLCLLLLGCAAQGTEPETSPLPSAPTEVAVPFRSTLTLLPPENEGAALEGYPLSEAVIGFLPLKDHLLFFSGDDTTTLTLLDPQTQATIAVHEAPLVLTPENETVQLLDAGLSYFHGEMGQTVVLDHELRPIRQIPAPEDLAGMPLLSPDGRTLYYCTSTAIRALDLDSGISRILKEAAYPMQGLSGLLLEGTVLQVSITEADGNWRTLFLSSETGQLLAELEGNQLPQTHDNDFFLCRQEGSRKTLLFGSRDSAPMVLTPATEPEDVFFLGSRVVTTGWSGDTLCMEVYSLPTSQRTASLSLSAGQYPESVTEGSDGCLWFLCGQQLFRWDPSRSPLEEVQSYASPYYTREEPDYDGLAACSLRAKEIGEYFGITVLVYKDAVATEPWDYHLDYEYRADVLLRELNALEQRLNRFPEGFLQTLAEKYTALNICIVAGAEGSPESGSPEAVNGIQFMDDFDAYIILSTAYDTEYALYHELSHLMETVILTESTAFDRWENLNPEDFRYDQDYTANQSRDGSRWLQPGKEYFIDTYSMSYAKEDRARLLEYAMTAGHEALFRSPNLQRKLRQLSVGIREGFGLEDSGPLPWEQYLLEE